MFVEKFIKKVFVSFYKDTKYHFYYEIKRNGKILTSAKKEFEDKKELENEIEIIKEDYTQYYIATIMDTINQGTIPTCNKKEMKKYDIDIDNVNYVCIKDYAIFSSLYDIVTLKKNYNFEIDYIFSIFAPIDFYAKKRNNYLYVLILDKKIALVAYKNNKPLYSDIEIFEEPSNEESDEFIEPLDDLDIVEEDITEDISENIEEEAQVVDLDEPKVEKSNIEYNIMEKLKDFIKEYYEHYSDDFIEKIIFLDTIEIGKTLKEIVSDELLLDSEIIKFDLLKTLTTMSEKENV